MNEQPFNTLADVEAYAASQGIVLTAKERAQIGAVQRAARDEYEQLHPATAAPPSFADKWAVFFPKFLDFIVTLGEVVLTLAQTVLTALGVPVVLVLLLIVEHQRVVHGIALFEVDYALASFAAAALVVLNLILELLAHHIEHKAGYQADRESRWSLRLWLANAAYTLGIGTSWQARSLSPAARYKRLLRLVTTTILALALVGSMRDVIAGTSGAWYEALVTIITESDLLTILTWAGGLLFAAAAVLSAQGLSGYVALRVVEIMAAMHDRRAALLTTETTPAYQADVDRAGAAAALALVTAKLEKRQSKPTASAPPAASNGHDRAADHADFLSAPPVYHRGDASDGG